MRSGLSLTVVKNLLCNAKDRGSVPGQGRSHMPRGNWDHVPQLLSLCSRAWKPQLMSPCAVKPRYSATRGSSPCTTNGSSARESLPAATKTQCSQRNKKLKNICDHICLQTLKMLNIIHF